MSTKNLVTVEKSLFVLIKDMRDEQKRFFELSKKAMAKKAPALWQERRECLASCKQLESYLDQHIENILTGKEGSHAKL